LRKCERLGEQAFQNMDRDIGDFHLGFIWASFPALT
jgi:hypothetical protein